MTSSSEPRQSNDTEGLVERLRDEATALSRVAWARPDGGIDACLSSNLANEAADAITTLQSQVSKLREALEEIAVYGCGMLNQPAGLNGPEEAWLKRRIEAYEQTARAILKETVPAVSALSRRHRG